MISIQPFIPIDLILLRRLGLDQVLAEYTTAAVTSESSELGHMHNKSKSN